MAITYDCGTRLNGTPLTLYGPEKFNKKKNNIFIMLLEKEILAGAREKVKF